jgi:hypothetical protein
MTFWTLTLTTGCVSLGKIMKTNPHQHQHQPSTPPSSSSVKVDSETKMALTRKFSNKKSNKTFYRDGILGKNKVAERELSLILEFFKEHLVGCFIGEYHTYYVDAIQTSVSVVVSVKSIDTEINADMRLVCDYYNVTNNVLEERNPSLEHLLLLVCFLYGWPPKDFGFKTNNLDTFVYEGNTYRKCETMEEVHYGVSVFK